MVLPLQSLLNLFGLRLPVRGITYLWIRGFVLLDPALLDNLRYLLNLFILMLRLTLQFCLVLLFSFSLDNSRLFWPGVWLLKVETKIFLWLCIVFCLFFLRHDFRGSIVRNLCGLLGQFPLFVSCHRLIHVGHHSLYWCYEIYYKEWGTYLVVLVVEL